MACAWPICDLYVAPSPPFPPACFLHPSVPEKQSGCLGSHPAPGPPSLGDMWPLTLVLSPWHLSESVCKLGLVREAPSRDCAEEEEVTTVILLEQCQASSKCLGNTRYFSLEKYIVLAQGTMAKLMGRLSPQKELVFKVSRCPGCLERAALPPGVCVSSATRRT